MTLRAVLIFVIDLILGLQNSMVELIFLVSGNDEFLHQNVNMLSIYMMLIQEIQLFELHIEITFQWAVWFSQLLAILTVISATYST